MQSSLKKSLYLGLAALSFVSVAAVSTNASAKSYAKAGAYTKLTAAATDRNVEATGTNALYTKPGTVKGAKIVASKKVMGELATSKKSANYFRAYGQKVTNRGSVYYRVVTMDGKYRGYVYGGKTEGTFAAGVKKADTTTTATTPTRTTGYYLKDVSKNTIWTAPKYTQYKASKVNLYGATKNDPFKVDSAATKTREGSLYYHVTDTKDANISGWVYAGKGYDATITDNTKQDLGGLSLTVAADAATSDNSVKVVYRDANNNNAQVGTSTWINAPKSGDAATKAGDTVATTAVDTANVTLSDFLNNNKPAGYALSGSTTAADLAATATYGNTVYVDVVASATSKVQLRVDKVDNTVTPDGGTATSVTLTNPLTIGTKLSSSDLTVSLSSDAIKALSGQKNTAFSDADITAIQTGLTTTDAIEGTKTYTTADGTPYHYQFTFEPDNFAKDNRTANYGDTLTASYRAQLVPDAATKTASDSSWIA